MAREEHPAVTRLPPTIPVEKRIEACDQAMENLRRKNEVMYEEHKGWEAYRAELVAEAQGAGVQAGVEEHKAPPPPSHDTHWLTTTKEAGVQPDAPKDDKGEHEDPNAPGGKPAEEETVGRAGVRDTSKGKGK